MSSIHRMPWACGIALACIAALSWTSSRAAQPNEAGAAAVNQTGTAAAETADNHAPTAKTATKTSEKAAVAAAEKSPIGLFAGMKSGEITVKFIAKNSLRGKLLVKNKTDQPLTVKLP